MPERTTETNALVMVPRELIESTLEVLDGTWVGRPCDDGCECILHPLRAALASSPPVGGERHPEDTCQRCGHPNVQGWSAPSALWNAVMGSEAGILCPQCFSTLAREKGIDGPWLFDRKPVAAPPVGGERPTDWMQFAADSMALTAGDIDRDEYLRRRGFDPQTMLPVDAPPVAQDLVLSEVDAMARALFEADELSPARVRTVARFIRERSRVLGGPSHPDTN